MIMRRAIKRAKSFITVVLIRGETMDKGRERERDNP